MANQRLNIDIVAKDKSKQALNNVQKGLSSLKQSVFNLQNAFIGLGAGLVIRNLVNTGKQLESLNVRLKFLFGSANEGAKAFNNMAKFASKVPFSLEEIQQGAGVLSVVSKDANELAHILEITGNVAAVTGLDFRTTAEQIQRSLSAGISSADLFRERGVKAMLGFSAGATVSVEQTVEAFERVFGKGGRFGKATDELAQTFEGTLSMIGDKIFNFKKVILEAGLFESLKKEFGALDKFLEENSKTIDRIATDIGIALGFAVTKVANGVILLKENMDKFIIAIKLLIALKVAKLFLTLGSAIQFAAKQMAKFSIASLMSTKSIKSLLVLIAKGGALYGAFKGIDKLFKDTAESFEEFSNSVKNVLPASRDFHKTMIQTKKEMQSLITTTQQFEHELSVGVPSAFEKARQQAFGGFKEGLQSEFDVTIFDRFKKAGQDSLGALKTSISDFVMTGKINFENLKVAIVRSLVEALIGSAVQSAIKKSSALFKMEAIKKAMISVYEGALKTFASIPFPFNIAATGLAIGAGMKLVDKIKGFAKGGAVSKGQPIMVGENGPELFVPNSTGQIEQSARGTDTGTTNINFTVNAVDVKGVEELLLDNRSTIVNVINGALNDQGKEALV
jgi:hypothetical protein|uniref:Bacteriophage tail tape measure C-terminal domain-containing protein n=1 Tax=uncultured marine virus TaxID=186617 RepID=A0A0F7L9L0_9VIRU|nr:protein of unknown function [uncultured marine virus]